MRKLIMAAVTGALLFACTSVAIPQTPVQIAAKVKQSIVKIQVANPKNLMSGNLGSGFIINGSSGVVMTALHLFTFSTNTYKLSDAIIMVRLPDDRGMASATVIAVNPDRDLALIKLNCQACDDLPSLKIADDIYQGEEVYAVAMTPPYPQITITHGLISSMNNVVTMQMEESEDPIVFTELYATDTNINHGNSGGPLVNSKGEVVGIIQICDERTHLGFGQIQYYLKKFAVRYLPKK